MIPASATLLVVFLLGVTVVLAMLVKGSLGRLGVPALVGFILLGFSLRLTDTRWPFMSPQAHELFGFFGELGIIILLFRVGLGADLPGLVRQLGRASRIWFWTVVVSGSLGFSVSYWWLDYSLIPSLFVAVALTATSVGVAVGIWQEADALRSSDGALLLDVAELDDISAVVFMALLMALAPVLRDGVAVDHLAAITLGTTVLFILKATLFGALCYLFSRYLEKPVTRFFERFEQPPDPMLTMTGIGLMFAALAGFLGFSMAIGAFFAGLVFSRDPHAFKMKASFDTLYELFVPFFFISIGLQFSPDVLTTALASGGVLLIAAVAGKLVGAGVPTAVMVGVPSGVLIGISMVPRAEIALIVMQQGHALGAWAVPPELFAGMVVVSAVTSLIAPLALRPLLERPRQNRGTRWT